MKDLFLSNISRKFRWLLISFAAISMLAVIYFSTLSTQSVNAAGDDKVQAAAAIVFTNPASINPADRTSNSAGTNPGIPPANYPSPIVVSGLSGTITKITVTFAITSTFPDDLDVLLVGPTGARSLVMSDAGGSGDHTNVTFTFDQTAPSLMPDGPTAPIPTGTFRPSNYAGLTAPEPGGNDNFPAPGPGVMAYTADFNVFNGTNPNGTWNLYVVDDQVIDINSLPGGWSIDITTAAAPTDAPLDFNGDGKTDYVVVRNTGGGSGGQVTWFYHNQTAPAQVPWGISTDFFVVEDFDGDGKDDITVYRPSAPGNSYFYILNSATFTFTTSELGATGDDPTIVGDYDGDGKADPAVFRGGASAGLPSFWMYRGSLTPAVITIVHWGRNGDFPAPGDYDGDGKNDTAIQRNNGSGGGQFWINQSTAGLVVINFGTSSDLILPGDYDGDGKTDLMVARGSAGQIVWYLRPSTTGAVSAAPTAIWGLSATDFPTQGDYNGDGKTDIAIWRPNADPTQCFFWVRDSVSGAASAFEWGQQGDYPVANFNSH